MTHNLLNPPQHGFLKARSCLTNILCFLVEITKWIDEGSPVDIIYKDFLKAFDKVPHQRLLLKLKAHDNITSNVLKFADDTKVLRRVNNDSDKQHLQNDLDKLAKWSEKWQIKKNGKSKCVHTGHWNLDVNYKS